MKYFTYIVHEKIASEKVLKVVSSRSRKVVSSIFCSSDYKKRNS